MRDGMRVQHREGMHDGTRKKLEKICLVEDSPEIQQLIKIQLKDWFQISCVASLKEATALLESEKFDLVLLDVMLPDGNGFEYCVQLRNMLRTRELPIVFLTGKGDPLDKMMAFSVGADDYVVKPIEPIELRARIQARMRKSRDVVAKRDDIAVVGDLKFDRIRQRVSIVGLGKLQDRDLGLTPFEFKVLSFLALRSGEIFNRAKLLKNVIEPNVHVSEENIYTHISAIRRKLGEKSRYIESIPRVGYRFSVPSLSLS